MKLSRRHFLASGLAAALPAVPALALQTERYPVFESEVREVPYRYRRREVDFETKEPPGTIIVATGQRFLFHVLGKGRAMRYGVAVGRQGESWSGVAVIQRKAKWPVWTPTPDQLAHYKVLQRYAGGMPGGKGNPLGARALYLYQGGRDTLYRIHGTIQPSTIGKFVSSGCIRMLNVDVMDLYEKVPIGTRVVVLDRKAKPPGT
jgi:lipoprotein-anchoring transpeptidase ErfK/SrfK